MARHAGTTNGQVREPKTPAPDGTIQGLSAGNDDSGIDSEEPTAQEGAAESVADAESREETDEADSTEDPDRSAAAKRPRSGVRLAVAFGILAMLALSGPVGWLGYHAYQGHEAKKERELYLQVARQGAVNLTTISYTEAEVDVQRILDSSTGSLYDDFLKRSQPFIEVVKQAQSTSSGTVTSAGLESIDSDAAQVLVTVQVKSSNVGANDQAPRAWRMRMTVQKVDDGAKVSNVAFVP